MKEIEEVTEDYKIELEDTEEDDTDKYIARNLEEMAFEIYELLTMPTTTIEKCKTRYDAIRSTLNYSEYIDRFGDEVKSYQKLLHALIEQNNKDTLSLIFGYQEYYKQ